MGTWVNADRVPLMALKPIPYAIFWVKMLWEYEANKSAPMGFLEAPGKLWTPDNHFFTDLGSVPICVQWLPGLQHDIWVRSYLLHDSCYKHGHLFLNGEEHALTKQEIDLLLFDMLRSEGASRAAASTIFAGVWAASSMVRYPQEEVEFRTAAKVQSFLVDEERSDW